MPHNPISYLVMFAVLGLVIARNVRGRRLRVEALWIMPVVMMAATGFLMASEPMPPAGAIAGFVVALAAGGAMGWQRGRFTRIELDPIRHSFTSRASPAGMIFLAVLFLARFGLRAYIAQTAHNPALTVAVTDGLMSFAVGLVGVQRVEMWLRCRRMLAQAKAGAAPA